MAFFESAGLELLSSGINHLFDKQTANYNFDLAEKSAENQYNRQLEFWNKQNAYNSPQAQVNRRLSAGLAPTDNVDSGNSSQLSSVPGNEFAQSGALKFHSDIDLLDSMRSINEIRNLSKTGDMLDEQIGNAIVDGMLKTLVYNLEASGNGEMANRIKGMQLDNERKKRENDVYYTPEYYKKALDKFQEELKKLKADSNISDMTWQQFNKTGVHPNNQGGPKDRLIFNAVTTLLSQFGYDVSTLFKGVKNNPFKHYFDE